ncbi:MAG: tripartite tricarboxylate transporter TctB family protein [Rhodospirillales bacterium]|nr:tripartite tricarboxylate transporter TctB family protein [Rhodospirillales bacterium]MDH3790227.1 tripartite tricarboxylate transporter TctB family protein [Rhodospirillales bacterium]MDH3910650.1 tripartite tricarboxylate transporter TctB family protein [Rhodospirillales bacterium]
MGDGSAARRLPRDVVVGACVLVSCAVAYAITFSFKQAPAALAQNVQPASFPRLVISVIAVLSAGQMILSWRLPEKALKPMPWTIAISAAVMIAFVIAFDALGIVPAMVLLCFGLPVLWGERRWHLIVPYAILFPAAIYGLFAKVLGVHFDPGLFGPW